MVLGRQHPFTENTLTAILDSSAAAGKEMEHARAGGSALERCPRRKPDGNIIVLLFASHGFRSSIRRSNKADGARHVVRRIEYWECICTFYFRRMFDCVDGPAFTGRGIHERER